MEFSQKLTKGVETMPTEQEAITALVKNDFKVVGEYLTSNDINKVLSRPIGGGLHGTLLHCASMHANEEATRFLLERKADPNVDSPLSNSSISPDESKAKPIHCLMMSGQPIPEKRKVLALLLTYKADINASNQLGRTAFDAVIVTRYEVKKDYLFDNLRLLAENKINVNFRGNNGKTSIYHALDRKTPNPGAPNEYPTFEYELCELLLTYGARPETLVNINGTTYSAATYALSLNKYRCYDLLNANLPNINLEKRVKELADAVERLQDRVAALEQKEQPKKANIDSAAALINSFGIRASAAATQQVSSATTTQEQNPTKEGMVIRQ